MRAWVAPVCALAAVAGVALAALWEAPSSERLPSTPGLPATDPLSIPFVQRGTEPLLELDALRAQEAGPRTLHGRFVRLADHTPIVGAQVLVDGVLAETDSDGRFLLESVAACSSQLWVQRWVPGLSRRDRVVDELWLPDPLPPPGVPLEFVLDTGWTVECVVVFERSPELPLLLGLRWLEPPSEESLFPSGPAGRNGWVWQDLRPPAAAAPEFEVRVEFASALPTRRGRLDLPVRRIVLEPIVKARSVPLNGSDKNPRPGMVAGTVTWSTGEPVADAEVRLRSLTSNSRARATSDGTGAFSITGVTPGEHELTARVERPEPSRPPVVAQTWRSPLFHEVSLPHVRVISGETLVLKVPIPKPGSISGRIVNTEGWPLEGAAVQLLMLTDSEALRQDLENAPPTLQLVDEMTTDRDGHYSFVQLPPGRVKVRAHVADATLFAPGEAELDLAPDEHAQLPDLVPPGFLTLRLQLSDALGRPFDDDCLVSLRMSQTGWLLLDRQPLRGPELVLTDLRPGHYDLEFFANGATASLKATAGGEPQQVVLRAGSGR